MSALCVKLERNSLYVPPPPQLSTCSMWTTRGKIIIYTHILPVAYSLQRTPLQIARTPNVKTVKCKNKKYAIFQEYSTYTPRIAFCNITVT